MRTEHDKGATKVSWVPEISDEEVTALLTRIQPLVRDEEGTLHTVARCDPRDSYPWCERAEVVDESSLSVVKRIVTYHKWGYYGFFKPTAAEVLAMVPAGLRDRVRAFEVEGPDGPDDLSRHHVALNAGYHVAVTTLYGDLKCDKCHGAPGADSGGCYRCGGSGLAKDHQPDIAP